MSSSVVVWSRAGALAIVGSLVGAASASSVPASPGGVTVPEGPRIEALRCADTAAVCRRGEELSVLGENMQGTDAVVFLGGRGARDDRRARPSATEADAITVKVPMGARSGRVKVVDRGVGAAHSQKRLKVRARVRAAVPPALAAMSTPPPDGTTFPIAGKHTYGTSDANRFGGAGGHGGQDVMAACGTPLVAAQEAKVTHATFQSRAGNYVVLQAADGRSFAYMHLEQPTVVKIGDRVTPGQRLGTVGATGRASTCHLHFELWTAPGWYTGGEAIDPLPQLKEWDR